MKINNEKWIFSGIGDENYKIQCVDCKFESSNERGIATEQVDKQNVQSEIRNVGYECDRVDDVQLSTFGNELNVTCDKVYRFTIRSERGGVTVIVIS